MAKQDQQTPDPEVAKKPEARRARRRGQEAKQAAEEHKQETSAAKDQKPEPADHTKLEVVPQNQLEAIAPFESKQFFADSELARIVSLWITIYGLTEDAMGEVRLNWGNLSMSHDGLSMTEPGPAINNITLTPQRIAFQGGGDVALEFQFNLRTITPIVGGSIQLPPGCSVLFRSEVDYSQVYGGSWYLRVP